MTLQEAIKSGKRFRRAYTHRWYFVTETSSIRYEVVGKEHGRVLLGAEFTSVDILADDWEIEEERISISKSQFEYAFNSAYDDFVFKNRTGNQLKKDIAYILGFKD